MKKITLIIFGCLAIFLCSMLANSCNKFSIDTDELSNTTWTGTSNDGYPMTLYLMFLSNHAVSLGTEEKMLSGTYSFDSPNVIVSVELDGETGKLGGVVAGNVMTLSDGTQQIIFKKH